jgi:glyoxylase-like metal-dependent hydrolase (beta-lactamase superfamily II)
MPLVVGDQEAVLVHTPGHSEDSICVFLPATGTLFSGDTLYRISDPLGAYPRAYLQSLERLADLPVRTIFPGHGGPVRREAAAFIRGCLANVRRSPLQD